MLAVESTATCFTSPGIAGIGVIGTSSGEVFAYTARDDLAVGKDLAHSSSVSAMDAGSVASTGAKIVASVSKTDIVVHEIVIKDAGLVPLAKAKLPFDPENDTQPLSVSFSPGSTHIAVCYRSGPVAVFELELPDRFYQLRDIISEPLSQDQDKIGSGSGTFPGSLKLVLNMSVSTVKQVLVGSPLIGPSSIEWQLQLRPDKSGKSDKPARGIYMWWHGCNKLALAYFENNLNLRALVTTLPPIVAPAATSSSPPPFLESKVEKTALSSATKVWMLPFGLTCSCSTSNGAVLAFGMKDGSVVVWDDHFGGHVRILPRMSTPVKSMAFVYGLATKIFCTGSDGSIYVADFNRPEESYTAAVKLPCPASQVYFLPSDPFAICMCPGQLREGKAVSPSDASSAPRLVWYNMLSKKLEGECVGKGPDLDFGVSCLQQFVVGKTPMADLPLPASSSYPCFQFKVG